MCWDDDEVLVCGSVGLVTGDLASYMELTSDLMEEAVLALRSVEGWLRRRSTRSATDMLSGMSCSWNLAEKDDMFG